MAIDVNSLSKAELQSLKAEVDKALASIDQRQKAEAKRAAEEAVRQYGFSLDQILGKGRAAKDRLPAKYRNPADPSKTWSGRGRQPDWIKAGIAQGKKISDFLI